MTVTTVPPGSLARWLLVERTETASPAARAGLQAGDIVLRAGELRLACALDLERALLDRAAGDTVPLLIRRSGAEKRLDLVLQSLEQAATPAADIVWRKLGVRLSPVNAELVSRNNQQLHGGVAILDLDPQGPAAKAGLQRGDILVGLHQWETVSVDNVTFVLTHPELASFNPLRFFIVRAGQIHKGWFQQVD